MACPFMLVRNLGKRLFPADRPWPRRLQGKWAAAGLLLLFFWYYEAFDPWAIPWLTAATATAYFLAAFVVDSLFRGAAFCKYLCPLGQFNFVNSAASPLEVRRRDAQTCARCTTKDCIAGTSRSQGCELWLFQQGKVGNLDCTFCLDCVHACPHDNVGIVGRTPGAELWHQGKRSGVGRLSERPDLAAMAAVLVFAAFMNAFGMVGPFYSFAEGVASFLGTRSEGVVLAVVLGVGLILLPALLLGITAWVSRSMSGSREPLPRVAVAFTFSLIPLGFGMWVAHYSFHFLTGALTLVPVVQSLAAELGIGSLGAPRWGLASIVPASWLIPIELLFLELGLMLSLVTGRRIAGNRHPEPAAAWRAFLPWALLAVALFAFGVWLMLQPMEMRGTFG